MPQDELTRIRTKERSPFLQGNVPPRALVLSVAALAAPVVGTLAFPEWTDEFEALLWLVALVPAFLLAYYRGWRGVATALAAGMAVLSLTHLAVTLLERALPTLLFPMVVAYLAVGLGVGWMAELLHRQRMLVEDLALTDPLTELPNRRHAMIFLEHEFGAAQRGSSLALVLFDLDDFKGYNDRYGHQAGDEALLRFSDILGRSTRRMNLSARLGGEEFVSVVTGSDERGAAIFADRVREAVQATELEHGSITVSAGVAAFHQAMTTPDHLIAAADLALYQAKAHGRNCVRVAPRPAEGGGSPEPEPVSTTATGVRRGSRAPAAPLARTPPAPRSNPPDGPPLRPLTHSPHESAAAPAPVQQLDREPTAPASQALPSRLGEGRQVLLVEDDPAVRATVATYLTREGFGVVEAGDVPGGLRVMSSDFDVVITDIGLPGPSGTELVAALKSRWPETQAIVMTGFRDVDAAAESLNAGADRYLLKPFELQELRKHLADALARRDQMTAQHRERERLVGEVETRAAEAHEAILRGTRALVRAVEVRDPYTLGHSERVARYAVTFARATEAAGHLDLDRLRLGCELHDVGKIGIPDAILNKADGLTPEEFAEVRKHPETGRMILEPLFGDDLILGITAWHHERWDGSGYPDGMAGESIPFEARLVAFADTLDAMTSTRAYRGGLPWDTAIEHILTQGGTQFDPALIEPFREAEPKLLEVYASLQG